MKKVEVKKIEEKELKKLQGFETFFSSANEALGSLTTDYEFKKSDILRQIEREFAKREEFKKELSETYGQDISIDLNTGEISTSENV